MRKIGNNLHKQTRLEARHKRILAARKRAGTSRRTLLRLEQFQRFQRELFGLSGQISALSEEFGATKNRQRERYEHFRALFGNHTQSLKTAMSFGKIVAETEHALLYFSIQKEKRVIPIIEAYLLHPNPRLRLTAVNSLGYYWLKSNARILKRATNDPDPKVRAVAISWCKTLRMEGK